MPNKSNKKRRSNNRPRGKKTLVSVVTTSIGTLAGNVSSIKTLTLPQLIPDVATGRQIVLQKIVVQATAASAATATFPGGMAQAQLYGEPFIYSVGGNSGVYASEQFKSLSTTQPTTLTVAAMLPGQKVPLELTRTGTCLAINAFSLFAGNWALTIKTHYVLLADNAVTAYA